MFNSCLYGDYYEGRDWRIPSSNFRLPQPIFRLPVLNYMCMVLLYWNKYGYFPSNSALWLGWQTEPRKIGPNSATFNRSVGLNELWAISSVRNTTIALFSTSFHFLVRPCFGPDQEPEKADVVEAAAAGAAERDSTALRPTRRSSRTKWMISLTVSRKWKGTKTSRPDSRVVTTSDQESTSNIQQGRPVISRGQVCPGSLMWLYHK